ncbi:hypothetical protein XELAEV_18004201mg [Xenopus laevis]|uniref:Uncharacterized protein n=1 Tax=Xenopus laevis TaxID=8355 RepID=A0A974BMT2_XENLA|nr:hypothetical protein XELAEV_18004201mg [Xenopus laevis]
MGHYVCHYPHVRTLLDKITALNLQNGKLYIEKRQSQQDTKTLNSIFTQVHPSCVHSIARYEEASLCSHGAAIQAQDTQ